MKTKNHYLASANTGQGFVNYFEYILDKTKPSFLYILKGGPGTGKSTMLKKIAEYFYENGEPIEYFYCSSDASSLDGIRLTAHNIAIVDGTAPHTTEASLPSVNEKIINLGECINDDIVQHKTVLNQLKNQKQNLYNSVYKYLAIAQESMLCALESCPIDLSYSQNILKKLDLKPFDKTGTVRHLFINFWGTKNKSTLAKTNNFEKTFYLDDNILSINENMQALSGKFIKLGYDVVMFHNILHPNFASALFLPQLNIFINSREKNNATSPSATIHFATSAEYQRLVCKTLVQTKAVHKEIEKYYIDNIDFDELTRITARIIGNIENRIECTSNS